MELGKLKKVKIRHDNKGGGAAWFLGHVEVEDPRKRQKYKQFFLLRKIALPYPHKCLLGFVEAKRGDQQEYLKIILVREVNPVVSDRCACAQPIVGWTLSRDPHSIFGRRGGCAFFFRRSSWRSHS